MPACDLPGEHLVAYLDGTIGGARKEYVEAHLEACPVCQRRLAEYREVERILRDSSPPIDDPAGRAAVMARVHAEATRPRRPARWRSRELRFALPVLLLLLAVVAWPLASQAGFPLERYIREYTLLEAEPTPASTAPTDLGGLTFTPVEVDRLPFDLELVERSSPSPWQLSLDYENSAGLRITLFQAPVDMARSTVNPARARTTVIHGTQVLWEEGSWSNSVDRLLWERHGLVLDLLVVKPPYGGLSMTDVEQIVAALIQAHDEMSKGEEG